MGRGGWVLLIKHFLCRPDVAGLGTDGSRRLGLINKTCPGGLGTDGSRRLGLINKRRMGRGGWVLLIKHVLCRSDLARLGTDGSRRLGLINKTSPVSPRFSRTWNGWVAAGESY